MGKDGPARMRPLAACESDQSHGSANRFSPRGGKRLPPVHPGRILREDMQDEEIGINGLARAIRVPANRISLIVNGKRGISADTAARLGRYFGTTAQYWLNIQNRFDLDSLDKAAIKRDVIPKKAA